MLREAEPLVVALDDPRRLGQVLVFLSYYFRSMGIYDQAWALRLLGEIAMHREPPERDQAEAAFQ